VALARPVSPRAAAALAALVVTLAATAARADDLAALLADARAANLDLAEQRAVADEAALATRVERAALLPRLSVSGGYTLNQHESVVRLPELDGAVTEITIVPHHQLDVTFALSLPVVDVAAWRRVDASRAATVARRAALAARAVEVERAVVVAWYQWVAGAALVEAARVAEATARDTVAVVEGRVTAGSASAADVARARADVATAAGDVAVAELAVATARQDLITLTGRAPAGEAPALPGAGDAEAPLAGWLAGVEALPEVVAARAERDAASAAAAVADAGWWPTVSVVASERISNAAGFGEAATFSVGVTASWQLDARVPREAARARAQARVGAVRQARAARDARDRITDAWNAVDARRATVDAAVARLDAARAALEVVRTRVASGLAAPVDLTVAQRDAFAAEVAALQARADLAAARALLRLAAGREVAP
jgi:outer membrane protein